MKFLFDIFPVILFFVAYKFLHDIYIATGVVIITTFGQVAWMWFKHRKIEKMLLLSLGIIVVFGGATIALHNETFIKWKPTVFYWAFALVLLVSDFWFKNNLIRAMMQQQVSLPEHVYRKLNISWIFFLTLMGCANLIVAYKFSTDTWVNFKLFGGLGLMFLFVLGQGVALSRYINEDEKK